MVVLSVNLTQPHLKQNWHVDIHALAFDEKTIVSMLRDLDHPLYIVQHQGQLGVTNEDTSRMSANGNLNTVKYIASVPALRIEDLGNPVFKAFHNTHYAYYAGSMAHAISSEKMVIEMGKAGFLSSFGAGGVPPGPLESSILNIQDALPNGPYAFNLIFNPNEPALERKAVELYLKHGVSTIEASAFLDLSIGLVHYRLSGLEAMPDGSVQINNRIIAKLSRREVAALFMQPAPDDIIRQLLAEGRINEQQANLANHVPMADDITVEADSGGHTDNRPLVCQFPSITALRDEIQAKYNYEKPLRIGAAGGISTPTAALAAFMMGADYIVTGSVNQACVESGTSDHTRSLLAQADMADVMMAPAADMFEMGVKVQLLKRGTLFPIRAQKLYEIYKNHASIETIPIAERQKLEKQVFKKGLDQIWEETVQFFSARDPDQVERASYDPKYKMALIFRWYLGLSSHWSNRGEKGREMDYQIWCGPAMGTFNDWVRGTYLEHPQNRHVVDIARQILTGTAYQYRIQSLKMQGVQVTAQMTNYYPKEPLIGLPLSLPNHE